MTAFASKPMAFLSDIHGNWPALQAVIAAAQERSIDDFYVAGDLLLGGEQPLEVWQELQRIGARCVRGVSDTALAALDISELGVPADEASQEALARFQDTREAIGELALARLRRLPEQIRIPMMDGREIVMVHGSPADATREMTHDLSPEEILSLVADDPADIVICGASHVPFRHDVEEVSIVNVGSVGQAPEGNIAHMTVVTPRMSGAEIQQLWVDYA